MVLKKENLFSLFSSLGEQYVGKFIGSNSKCLILDSGKFLWGDIRATTINKNRTSILLDNEENNITGKE